jgi:hypothetical protein
MRNNRIKGGRGVVIRFHDGCGCLKNYWNGDGNGCGEEEAGEGIGN